ncbi:MAG: M1 family metallopeptidase [Candidatus Aminicenantes bacterium]|nr:M1 family metallopeptidase [Candidatus Aminicenantes bacterium]
MKKPIISALLFLFVLSQLASASMSEHIVSYKIKVKLLPEEKAVAGQEVLTWLNNSDQPVGELQFHLYLNAFKNNKTTFITEGGGEHRGYKLDKKNWGYIKIEKFAVQEVPDLTDAIEYIQPDDGNEYDQTVMRVKLPKPVLPQETVTLEIDFYSKLPKVFARSGFYSDFFMVGQWFPKIGVFWKGEWNCHQYHVNTEFFADYGVYEVEITVPEEYVVGATGKRIKETSNNDGTKTYIHYQEDVHDFAWTACPDFVEFREPFRMENPHVDTEMILLIHRMHLNHKERYLNALKNGIEFYSQSYGAYPYSTITLVDPAPKATGAGGMEYPTLFTGMTMWWLPKGIYMTEMVTIHEFGHNYWYGMVGSNEFEEAWLDEGINTYSEVKATAKYFGEDQSMLNCAGLKISDLVLQRAQVMGSSQLDPILKNSWEYYSIGSYGLNTYSKAGLMLLTLENYLGEDVMSKIMRTYFERWKFKHPTSEDFLAVAEEVSGQDLSWFFDQFLNSPDRLDYAIGRIKSEEVKEPKGIFDDQAQEQEMEKGKEEGDKEKIYRNEVNVLRKGELIFPQEILIRFKEGEEVMEKWDGRERWKRYVYYRPYKLESAQVDPEYRILLDMNFTNNSKLLKPKKLSVGKHALRLMFQFQNILSLFSF